MSRFCPAPEVPMSRVQKDPLRPLRPEERAHLERVSRAFGLPAALVARAKALLAVANGCSYIDAAHLAGRRTGDAVAALVSLFNRQGPAALEPRHAGGPAIVYDVAGKQRILTEFRRKPDRERDGTAAWSLTTLQRALRRAPDGLPWVSTYTIWYVLHEAGLSWQRDRSWCKTGAALRRRKRGGVVVEVEVHDPDAAPKKLGRQTCRVEEAFGGSQIGGRVMPESALESACCLSLIELLSQGAPLRQILRL